MVQSADQFHFPRFPLMVADPRWLEKRLDRLPRAESELEGVADLRLFGVGVAVDPSAAHLADAGSLRASAAGIFRASGVEVVELLDDVSNPPPCEAELQFHITAEGDSFIIRFCVMRLAVLYGRRRPCLAPVEVLSQIAAGRGSDQLVKAVGSIAANFAMMLSTVNSD